MDRVSDGSQLHVEIHTLAVTLSCNTNMQKIEITENIFHK